jgi:hypothetical protein
VTVTLTFTNLLDNGVDVTKMDVSFVVKPTMIGVGEKAKWGAPTISVVVATGTGIIWTTVVKKTVLVNMMELVEIVMLVTVFVSVVVSVTTREKRTSLICVKVIVEVSITGESTVVVIVTVAATITSVTISKFRLAVAVVREIDVKQQVQLAQGHRPPGQPWSHWDPRQEAIGGKGSNPPPKHFWHPAAQQFTDVFTKQVAPSHAFSIGKTPKSAVGVITNEKIPLAKWRKKRITRIIYAMITLETHKSLFQYGSSEFNVFFLEVLECLSLLLA